ncbi:hypothetical protein L1049_001412 [Liquidambar formosana]|uniref:Uncharacterized protein n=1 Tax=Liquidambar formosana TaxID=63359 RepID=A0AAP0NAV7_LIQFO
MFLLILFTVFKTELNMEEPSRNIIETIFQKATTNPSEKPRKIQRVIRVKNSSEILERFENHRIIVKKEACEQYESHPRIIVDGNELLLFYGTIMTCCSDDPGLVISKLCEEPSCGVCRAIQSNFGTKYTKNGIPLSTSSDALSETMHMIGNLKGKNVKMATIVCRTIAGRVATMVDGENEQEHAIIRRGGRRSELEYLIVKDPNAILPCFVILFT